MTETSYIFKYGKDIKVTNSIERHLDFRNIKDYIGKISIKQNEEYIWTYNNYFENNKFVKPYDSLDWVVIGPTRFSSSNSITSKNNNRAYKLSEGDFIKLGKITFLVRKIKINSNENLKDTKRQVESNSSLSIDNCNSNMNINVSNSINEELAIYNRFNNSNYNYINTDNKLLQSIKTRNDRQKSENKDVIISETVNNKLRSLYIKLKTINEKQKLKPFKCRICFCEGSFDGNDPLISPCKCIGSLKYIHLNCFRKWLTSKVTTKSSSTNNIYCYTFKSLECEICKSIIPEIVEYRGKFISVLDFKDIDPPYIILQTVYQYGCQNRNLSDFNVIFVMSFKLKDYLIIGRANNSDIRLSDVSVSRSHSKITFYDGNFYINDEVSKFGTLLLIQNDILFLPFKDISIQTGKCLLNFRLMRTFLGCFKCFKNSIYEKMCYEEYFNKTDKKVYFQILESFNYNIVDPVEKFNSLSGSCSGSENNSINCNNEKKSEEFNEINEKKDDNNDNDDKTEKINKTNNEIKINNSNIKYMFENLINIKNIKKIENNKENDNEFNKENRYNDREPTINQNINHEQKEDNSKLKMNGSIFIKKLNNSFINENKNNNSLGQKQNESNDILIHDIKSRHNQNIKIQKINNFNFSALNIINIFKNRNGNKKPETVLNFPFNNKLNSSQTNNKINENTALVNTQRENKNISKRILDINKSFE